MRITRDGSEARNPTGNTVPSTIGTSPKTSPGRRSPTTRSIAVDGADRLDAPLQHGEQRPLGALVRRVLSGHQAHVGGHARETLELVGIEIGEERDTADLLRA